MSVWALGQESEQGTHEQKEVTDMAGRGRGGYVRSWSSVLLSLPQFTKMLSKVAGLSPDPFPQT